MSNQNKKILFVVSSIEYYRNFITTTALDGIKQNCVFLVHAPLSGKSFPGISRDRIFSYQYPDQKKVYYKHVFNINMWKFRKKSTSFEFRFFSRLKKRLKIIYKILSLPIIYHLVQYYFLHKAKDPALYELVEKINPALILIPSSGYDGLSFELIEIAKKKGIKSCMLIDNWDNLSSKTIFTRKPDFMTVWGKQAREDAKRIHDMKDEQIFELGTPRFINYNPQKTKGLTSPYPFRYALFAGNALPFDELSALRAIDKIISDKNLDIKIVYRPHPWRKHRKSADTFFGYDFKNVIIDEQAKTYYKRDEMDEYNDIYMPDLNYYPRLLSNMEFMICPLSTMIIEGLFFNKNVAVLIYDDGIHLTNPKACYKYYEHFRGIDKLKNILLIDDINSIKDIFELKPAVASRGPELDYFITPRVFDYPLVLKETVDKILRK
jgi:hypothetical protein